MKHETHVLWTARHKVCWGRPHVIISTVYRHITPLQMGSSLTSRFMLL